MEVAVGRRERLGGAARLMTDRGDGRHRRLGAAFVVRGFGVFGVEVFRVEFHQEFELVVTRLSRHAVASM